MRFIILIGCVFLANVTSAQINLSKLKNVATKAQEVISPVDLSQDEVIKGLKEALIVGATNSTAKASEQGGFNNNPTIKIPFPEDAERLKTTLEKLGMQSQVDEFQYVLNETAEDASNLAKEIFINAVKTMTINEIMRQIKKKLSTFILKMEK